MFVSFVWWYSTGDERSWSQHWLKLLRYFSASGTLHPWYLPHGTWYTAVLSACLYFGSSSSSANTEQLKRIKMSTFEQFVAHKGRSTSLASFIKKKNNNLLSLRTIGENKIRGYYAVPLCTWRGERFLWWHLIMLLPCMSSNSFNVAISGFCVKRCITWWLALHLQQLSSTWLGWFQMYVFG